MTVVAERVKAEYTKTWDISVLAVTLWARHWNREYCCIVLNVECAKGVVAVVACESDMTSNHK